MKGKRLHANDMRKRPEANLRNYYTILLETGLILALLILTALVRMEFTSSESEVIAVAEQEAVEMEEIIQTQQQETPPPPPRPPSPVAVPNDEIIEDVDIMIDAEIDFGSTLDMPPPPQQRVEEEEEEDFFVVVEQMPELIGGLQAIQAKIRYPERALRAGIEGRVYVQFIVSERGDVENPHVIRGIGGGCDEEAMRVVSEAKFVPGMQRGRPVRVQFYLPVVFRITN